VIIANPSFRGILLLKPRPPKSQGSREFIKVNDAKSPFYFGLKMVFSLTLLCPNHCKRDYCQSKLSMDPSIEANAT
jgi:hypothetical protein